MQAKYTNEDLTLLVRQAQARDQHAFEALYTHYQARVASWVFALLGPRTSVADITQEVWLAVFLALPTLNQPAAFAGWLLRITRHKAWQYARHHRQALVSLDEQQEEDQALLADANVEAEILQQEQTTYLASLLARLTDKEREVLIPFYLEEASLADIAARLKVSLSAVKSRLHQGRKRLRLMLLEGESSL